MPVRRYFFAFAAAGLAWPRRPPAPAAAKGAGAAGSRLCFAAPGLAAYTEIPGAAGGESKVDHLLEYAPLVRAMARRYLGPGLEREDLEQEAWLALVAAGPVGRNGPAPGLLQSRVRAALAQALRRFRRDALFYKAPLEGYSLAAGEELDGLWQWTRS